MWVLERGEREGKAELAVGKRKSGEVRGLLLHLQEGQAVPDESGPIHGRRLVTWLKAAAVVLHRGKLTCALGQSSRWRASLNLGGVGRKISSSSVREV